MKNGYPDILVVDDEVDTCRNMADIFGDLGYQVDVAHNGIDALELVKKQAYDVVLLDLKMPGMDGLTLYRKIKALSAGTIAIVVTAYASNAITTEALGAGALDVLTKPVDFPKLVRLMDQALTRPLVLLVDDDQDLCNSLWDLLHEHEYRICVAHDEIEADNKLQARDYHLVLIDMKLPRGNGQGVFHKVRYKNPRTPTIAITGCRTETASQVQTLLEDGADAVCYKPFDLPALLCTMERLAGRN